MTALLAAVLAFPVPSQPGHSWSEPFRDGALPAGWRQHASEGNRIAFRSGFVEFDADLNTHAYVARPLGVDGVSVAARIRPSVESGVTWATSLFVVWDGGNWCQLGVITRNARAYVVETEAGVTTEYEPAPADPTAWTFVRIEVGHDVLRYETSEDGRTWRTVRAAARPASFKGPPRTVALGKGYGRGAPPYGAPELRNDYADRGPRAISMAADARVAPLPPGRMTMSAAERRAAAAVLQDPVGSVELARPGDPVYERVAAHFPPMKHPREQLGVPRHAHGFGLDGEGRFTFTDGAAGKTSTPFRLEAGDPPRTLASGGAILERRLQDGWMPLVTLNRGTLEQTAFGWSDGFSPTSPLYLYVRLRLRGPAARVVLRQEGSAGAVPIETHPEPGGRVATVRVPFGDTARAEPISPSTFDAALKQARSHWMRLLARGALIETPDERLNRAWRAWICWSLLNVHLKDGFEEAHDGTSFYDVPYGYSAGLYVQALDLFGMHDQAERCLEAMLSAQQPDGLYTQNFGLPDQGALLLAMADHYRLTGRRAWLARVADRMERACEWIVRQRASAPRSGLGAGLIKARAYCDYPEPVVGYFGDTYCWLGLQSAADVLGAVGRKATARGYAAEAARYRADILRSMTAAPFRHRGISIMPLEPLTRRISRDSRFLGGDYYSLVAGCLLETEFLPAKDWRTRLITDHMERRGGITAGVPRFQDGIDHAYGYGYLLTHLKRGDARRYLLGLWGMMAYGMTRDTFSGVEVTYLKTGQNYGTLPHTYSSTQQLRTLRTLFAREQGSTLHLGEAVPQAWLAPGKRFAIRGAPTRFGTLTWTCAAEPAAVRVTLRLPVRAPARTVRLALRRAGGPVRSVTVQGKPWKRFGANWVELPGGLPGAVEVVARYERQTAPASRRGGKKVRSNTPAGTEPAVSRIFVSGEGGYHTYRIPALAVTARGVLLAFCEGRRDGAGDSGQIDVVVRRSRDNGATWDATRVVSHEPGSTTGNPCPIVERTTGRVHLLLTRNLAAIGEGAISDGTAPPRSVWVTTSDDDGVTWTPARDISAQARRPDWRWYATGPCHGIQLRDGRLVAPCDHTTTKGASDQHSHVIYSDDHGSTWRIGGVVGGRTNECAVLERADGSLYLNARSYAGTQRRATAESADRGGTWGPVLDDPALIEPVCQGSVIDALPDPVTGKPRSLFSNPAGLTRANLAVRLSHDEGRTWTHTRTLWPGPAAYSDLAITPDGRAACLFEAGERAYTEGIVLARFAVEWVARGRP